jgi:hypothetical protein
LPVAAGALSGTLPCQQLDSEDEDEADAEGEGFNDLQGAEEALVEAVADTLVPLAAQLGSAAFLDAWKVLRPL